MAAFVDDGDTTREGDLANWQNFCLAYYNPILRALKLLRVPEGEVDDLAHSFLLKVVEKNYLESYRSFQEKEARDGRRARFRTYLYRSLQNHVRDFYRKSASDGRNRRVENGAFEQLAAEPETTLHPDTIFALDVLHQALQALRRHCERTGKAHFWVFFEETLLANEFRGRRGKTRRELLDAFPDVDPQRLDNSLTTAKRAFRRFVEDVIPRGLRDEVRPGERFDEWMAILRDSNASQFNLLHLAYRVMPFLAPDMSQTASAELLVRSRFGAAAASAYEEPVLVPDEDELSILLGFHLELSLTEMLDPSELTKYIPPSNALWSFARARFPRKRSTPQPARQLCLLTLVEPTPGEAEALLEVDLVGLLTRLKLLAKQLRHRPDHAVPEIFAQLLYTLVNVLAMLRCKVDLHTVGSASLARNVRWFQRQSWLDERLRPLFDIALQSLESAPASVADNAKIG
jgi:DNA-directed RNA polymerase specialized sigma24 family protein